MMQLIFQQYVGIGRTQQLMENDYRAQNEQIGFGALYVICQPTSTIKLGSGKEADLSQDPTVAAVRQ